ncbi:MAG: hypothetical protein HKN89_00610 [Eudoraea sp.]|nr:hypothetical protein [Eudoraea sp.]
MKNAVFTGVLTLFSIALNAQFSGQVPTNMSSGGSSDLGAVSGAISSLLGPISEADQKRSYEYEQFRGSPYVSNNFAGTTLYYKEDLIGDIYYRFNSLNQEIEIKTTNSSDEGIRSLGRDKGISIVIDGRPMSFKTFIDKTNRTTNGYLVTLEDTGKYKLYKRYHATFQEGLKASNSFAKDVPAKFTQYIEYYIEQEGANRVDYIKLNKGSVLRTVSSEKRNALKEYIKDNELNLRNEVDLVKVIQFLNS